MSSTFTRANLLRIGLFLFLLPGGVAANFRTLETKHLRLIYFGSAQSYLVKHTARCFENAFTFHHNLFDYDSREKITVALYDPSDFGNAGAGTVPWNAITLAIAPPSYAFETTPSNERINATMNHELVHIVAGDKATVGDRFFRALFCGKLGESSDMPPTILYSYLTEPRRSAPRWYHEGIAVFLETWMAGGLGRALGSYDEMVFRTAVRDGERLYDVVGLESEGTKINFQVGAMSYLYGGRFMSYLAWKYSPEHLVRWVSRTSGSKGYYGAQFKRVFEASLDKVWGEWLTWERGFQQANLERIRTYPTTPSRKISVNPLGAVSRPQLDSAGRRLLVAIDLPGQISRLASISLDDGRVSRLCDIKGPAMYFVSSIALDPYSQRLFYTTDNNSWRGLSVLDLQTGTSKRLASNMRTGDLTFDRSDSSLWGVRHFNGISTLVNIPSPYTEWHQVRSWEFGRDMYGLDISPDGAHIVAGLSEINGTQRLVRLATASLRQGDSAYQILHDFGNTIPSNFVHTADGRYLIGTSYFTGVSNVFRYDLEANKMEALTNCETGFFNPIPTGPDSMIAFEYSASGFLPVAMAIRPIEDASAIEFLGQAVVDSHPVVKTWIAGSPGQINLDSLTTYSGAYHPLVNIRLASMYPIVEGYRDAVAYGLHANFRDPINMHNIELDGSYSPDRRLLDDEKWHAAFSYSHKSWRFNFKYNEADFYDLFGPTKTSRKGMVVGLQFRGTLLQDDPRTIGYRLSLNRYSGLTKLPEFQNITTSFDHFWSFTAGLNYRSQRASLGAVDYEKGIEWRMTVENKYVNGTLFNRTWMDLDLGTPLFGHSSLWLRSSAGYSPNRREEPLANFYFGGFGNNWVDNKAEKQYRDNVSFPGIGLNEVGGISYIKAMGEWNLPPLRFRRLGTPSFFFTWLRPALFATALVTSVDYPAMREQVFDVGAQLDIRIIALSHLNLTLSVGKAWAMEKGRRPLQESMVSLKVL